MKLSNKFLMHISDGETFIIPSGEAGFSGVIRGNKTLGDIVSFLEHDTVEEDIVRAMCERYDAPYDVIEHDVRKAIDNLRSARAIVD